MQQSRTEDRLPSPDASSTPARRRRCANVSSTTGHPAATDVVGSVGECDGFFLDQTPPEIPGVLEDKKVKYDRYKLICQKYNNDKKFMTLYDTAKKIPVFSAYKYTGHTHFDSRVQSPWTLEEGIDDQATEEEYSGARNPDDYQKGHLFPVSHANTEEDQKSTYKLTNSVPQVGSFNVGRWKVLEGNFKKFMDENCIHDTTKQVEAFVITGAISEGDKKLGTITVPDSLWTAFCCKVGKVTFQKAAWDTNIENNGHKIPFQTLEELNKKLQIL
ncbi:endonuclease domain-containing 1 protein-like [Gadus chalcogrammus]|uniref:endonuclease domain-containing 1 protein-like n=1 Tax=Gadus chalcogrammus TaxID=1042646 RepID=UPI0024C48D83|nr:endonuclease domain-containing 1 protein-like [Gadus chalcogrammus]